VSSKAYRATRVNEVNWAQIARGKEGLGATVGIDVGKFDLSVICRSADGQFECPWPVRNPLGDLDTPDPPKYARTVGDRRKACQAASATSWRTTAGPSRPMRASARAEVTDAPSGRAPWGRFPHFSGRRRFADDRDGSVRGMSHTSAARVASPRFGVGRSGVSIALCSISSRFRLSKRAPVIAHRRFRTRPLSRVAPECHRPVGGPLGGARAVRDHHPDRDDLPRARGGLSRPASGRPTGPIAACMAVALRGRRPGCDVAGHRPRRDDPAQAISGRAAGRGPRELARYRERPRSQVSPRPCPSLAPRTAPIIRARPPA
jgi:hypothetical protein